MFRFAQSDSEGRFPALALQALTMTTDLDRAERSVEASLALR